jgi:hypothetical protein
MPTVVRAFPLRGSLSEFEAFAKELQVTRQAEAAAFYRQYGVEHESWHLQQTDHGPWVIVVTLVQDPGSAAPKYAKSTDQFSAWFKKRVLDLSGVDPNVAPLGPPTKQVFNWSDTEQIASTFAPYSVA